MGAAVVKINSGLKEFIYRRGWQLYVPHH